eukprot:29840-Pyramimonas_sp.AAC.1
MVVGDNVDGGTGSSVKLAMGPRNVAVGEAPSGAMCRNWCGGRMRTVALGPSVELPVGPFNV